MIYRIAVVLALLVLGACGDGGSGSGDDMDELKTARESVGTEVETVSGLLTDALGGEAGEVSASYTSCGSSPTDAIRYHEFVDWSRDASTADLDEAAATLESNGWTLDPPSKTTAEVRNLRHDDVKLTLKLLGGVLTWSVEGECVRVSSKVANDLVGPVG